MLEETISKEELSEIIGGYINENPAPEREPVSGKGKITIQRIQAHILNTEVQYQTHRGEET